jgi:hypothetical protein
MRACFDFVARCILGLVFAVALMSSGHAADEAVDSQSREEAGASDEDSARFVRLGIGAGYTHLQIGKHDGSDTEPSKTTSTPAIGILNLEATFGTRTSERNAFYGWSVLEGFFVPQRVQRTFRGYSGGLGGLIKLGVGDEVRFGDDRVTLSVAAGSVLQLFAFASRNLATYPPVNNEVRATVAPGVGGEIQLAFRLNDTTRPDGLAIYGGSHVVFRDGRQFVGGQVGLRAIVWRRGLR